MMTTTWKVMWMMRWRRSSPSTFSLELALAPDPALSPPPAAVPVPHPPMENLRSPADLVVDNPPDLHKGHLLTSSLVPRHLKALSPNAHLPLVPKPLQPDRHPLNAHHHLQVEARQQWELLDLEALPDRISLLELG